MFELRGRFGIARQKLVKMIHGSEKENVTACNSSDYCLTPAQQADFLPSVNHSLREVEFEKAQALLYSRRMLDNLR